ncbi:hypothetical protein B0T20DRAFT_243670 [Sordaria brevicollis]|uniref:Secreted protein n=1 Tax=Sordaria brevicollis TaxID=83679 RepID=A0AAE0UAV7_SORBR|nr:hypothetical protein B0T20DRAFT_243670 [Sordaria brevicollis]
MIPCWANLGCCYRLLHSILALCGRAHPTPPSICTFCGRQPPGDACLQPAVVRLPYRQTLRLFHRHFSPFGSNKVRVPRLVTRRWQITLGHLHGTHTCPAQSQPASPPCLHAYQSHHQNDSRKSGTRSLSEHPFSVHSLRTTVAGLDSSLVTPKERDRLPRRHPRI